MNENIAQSIGPEFRAQQFCCPNLPLAVYREVAAHLRQVTGVEVELLPQLAQTFDYRQSQIGGLRLSYTSAANPVSQQRVQQILAYYGERYGDWQQLE
jgi:hypothetical protein